MVAMDVYVNEWRPRVPIHRGIWDYLRQHAVGPESSRTAAEIAAATGIRDNAQHTRTRAIVGAMIDDGAPIVATHRGFHVATDSTQLADYQESLNGRAHEIQGRSDAVRRILGQLDDSSPDPPDAGDATAVP